jgi:hypothetical protein
VGSIPITRPCSGEWHFERLLFAGPTDRSGSFLTVEGLLSERGLKADAALQLASGFTEADASDAPPGALVGQGSIRYRD